MIMFILPHTFIPVELEFQNPVVAAEESLYNVALQRNLQTRLRQA